MRSKKTGDDSFYSNRDKNEAGDGQYDSFQEVSIENDEDDKNFPSRNDKRNEKLYKTELQKSQTKGPEIDLDEFFSQANKYDSFLPRETIKTSKKKVNNSNEGLDLFFGLCTSKGIYIFPH